MGPATGSAVAALLRPARIGIRRIIDTAVGQSALLGIAGLVLVIASTPFVVSWAEAATADRVAEALQKINEDGAAGASDRQAIVTFYRGRGFAPLWIEQRKASARAKTVIESLKSADTEGLEPGDYLVVEPAAGAPADAIAEFDLTLTSAVLRFARDVAHGRLSPDSLGKNSGYELQDISEAGILPRLAEAADPAEILASLAPQQQGYKALRQKLASLRAGSAMTTRDLRRRPGGLALIDMVAVNMERWRWMPRELGPAHVMVNIPDYSLRLLDGDQKKFEARIVVGTPSMPTPLMSSTIPSMTINPLWKVPQTMAEREYLPAIAVDPAVAEKFGVKMAQNRDGTQRLYQTPGGKNVLGRIRFNIPNQLLIFQHDTPDKLLFELEVRTYSHGCMRIEDATGYAEALLAVSQPQENYTRDRLRALFGDNELKINLTTPVPVHLSYQTAFIDSGNTLVLRDDVYGIDLRMLAALKQNRRNVAAINRFDSR